MSDIYPTSVHKISIKCQKYKEEKNYICVCVTPRCVSDTSWVSRSASELYDITRRQDILVGMSMLHSSRHSPRSTSILQNKFTSQQRPNTIHSVTSYQLKRQTMIIIFADCWMSADYTPEKLSLSWSQCNPTLFTLFERKKKSKNNMTTYKKWIII